MSRLNFDKFSAFNRWNRFQKEHSMAFWRWKCRKRKKLHKIKWTKNVCKRVHERRYGRQAALLLHNIKFQLNVCFPLCLCVALPYRQSDFSESSVNAGCKPNHFTHTHNGISPVPCTFLPPSNSGVYWLICYFIIFFSPLVDCCIHTFASIFAPFHMHAINTYFVVSVWLDKCFLSLSLCVCVSVILW